METYFGEIEAAHNLLARERALADLKTLAHDSEDLMKATAHGGGEEARETRSRLAKALERAKATVVELQGQAVSAAQVAAQKADTAVRGHPYHSVGVAFGLGVMIGVLITRKNHRGKATASESGDGTR